MQKSFVKKEFYKAQTCSKSFSESIDIPVFAAQYNIFRNPSKQQKLVKNKTCIARSFVKQACKKLKLPMNIGMTSQNSGHRLRNCLYVRNTMTSRLCILTVLSVEGGFPKTKMHAPGNTKASPSTCILYHLSHRKSTKAAEKQ